MSSQSYNDKGNKNLIDNKNSLDVGPNSILEMIQQSITKDIIAEVENINKVTERNNDVWQVNESTEFVLGIDLSKNSTPVVLLDLDAEVKLIENFSSFIGEEELTEDLPFAIEQFLLAHQIDKKQIKWVSIGLPGEMDEARTNISYSYYLQVSDLPLKSILEGKLNLPITLMNDLEAAVYAESIVKNEKYHTIAYALIDKGVGTSFILHNEFYRGANGGAGKMYQLGRYGAELTYNDLITNYPEIFAELSLYEALDKYVELGLNGTNIELRDKLDYMIEHMGAYFASILQLLDLQKMIIAGWITRNEQLFNRICTQIQYKELAVNNPTELEAPHWKENGIAVGAAIMGIYHYKHVDI